MRKEGELTEAVQSPDRRKQLEGLRDFLVNELDGARCDRCDASRLKTGDTAALVLRLQKVLEELSSLPAMDQRKSGLAKLREQANNVVTPFDRKNSPRNTSTRQNDKKRDA